MNGLKTKLLWLMFVTALVVLTGVVGVPVGAVGGLSPSGKVVVELEGLPNSGYNIIQEDVFEIIDMEGFALTSSPGDPMLPHKIYDILIPLEAIESTVKLKIVSAKKQTIDGTYNIKAAGPDVSRIDDQVVQVWGGKNITDGKNINVYQNDADFPDSPVKILCCSQMRKWKFVRVDFSPFQYNPVTKKLTLTESIQIEISYDKATVAPASPIMTDTVLDDIAPKRFLNFSQIKDSYQQEMLSAPTGDEPSQFNDYVIITTNAINTNSTKLNAFVTHKQNQGFSVYVATYEVDIVGLTGQSPDNRAEKIRQWLINNYITDGIEYVLLIGDPSPFESGEGDIPMKMCHPERNASGSVPQAAPTDYFYADLTGNWDIDNDQFYGEWDPDGDGAGWSGDFPVTGGVDFTEEVYVGRIPVYDANYTALDNILQKIIDYETEPGNLSWRSNVLLPMGFQDASGPYDGAQLAEQMKDDYIDAAGYSRWRMYQQGSAYASDNSIYTSDEELRGSPGPHPAGQDTVENEWTNDAVYGINCWWAHGSATSASVGYSGHWDGTLFQSSYCPPLDDDHPAFTYQCSCTNGHPETSNNLQYEILRNGGIGTVSATRTSWFNAGVNYGQFDGSTTNSGIGYEYVKRLIQNLDDGVALYQAKSSMLPGSPTRLANWYDFNLYGCPAVCIAVFKAPVAHAGGPYSACVGAEITFDASASYDPDGKIVLYEWDFDDNGVYDVATTATTIAHAYSSAYSGLVRLRVTDNDAIFGFGVTGVEVGDTIPPVITCPPHTVSPLECPADTSPAATGTATATDDCDDSPTIDYEDDIIPGCGNSEIIIRTWTATDNFGNSASCVQVIIVEDTTPPMVTLNGDAEVILECHFDTYTELGATASDDCDPGPIAVTIGGDVVDTDTVGTYVVTYDAVDDCGNHAVQVTRTVNVVDTTPPEVTVDDMALLWPPNHKYNQFKLSDLVVSVLDACAGPLDVDVVGAIISIHSDEPENAKGPGDGDTLNDMVILDNSSFKVRSERLMKSNGRVYSITFKVVDPYDNITVETCYVGVLPNESGPLPVDGPGAGYTVP